MNEPKKQYEKVPLREIDHRPYDNANKIPIIVGSQEANVIKQLKDLFITQLNYMVGEEMKYCRINPYLDQQMTPKMYNYVCDLVDQCRNPYDLDVLNDMLFKQNYVPESFDEVKQKSLGLRLKFPILDLLKKYKYA